MDEFNVGAAVAERYETKRVIARGGICVITEAVHRFTGRQVVIKQLDEPWLEHSGAQNRLLREARLTEMARHPNVVEVIDAGIDESKKPYLVMERLVGRTLAGLLTSRTTLTEQETVAVGIDICRALGAAHAQGIVHRDVKPANVMLAKGPDDRSVVKLMDFGIATTRTTAGSKQPGLTEPGELIGTPQYMSPELLQMMGEAGARVDVYSLGVVLYECLTGRVPHEGNYGAILVKVLTKELAPPCSLRPDIRPTLNDVIMRALAHQSHDRYPDTISFAEALEDAIKQKVAIPKPAQLPSFPVPPVQRRKYERQPYVTLVRITQADGLVLDGRSEDISEGGMLVLTPRECANGMKAEVRFALPLSGRVVSTQATLRWVRMGRGSAAVGLQFDDLEAELQIEIGQYVSIMARTNR